MRRTVTPPDPSPEPPGNRWWPRRTPTGRRAHQLRSLGNLANLSTPLGLVLARLGGAQVRPGPSRLLLAEGYRFRFPTGCAFTVGDVVLTRGRFGCGDTWSPERFTVTAEVPDDRPRPLNLHGLDERVLTHEGRHAWQWAACGPAFLPAYVLALGWSWWRTGDLAAANVFERLAGLTDGGYAARQPAQSGRPVRSRRVGRQRQEGLSVRSGPRRPRRLRRSRRR